MKKTQISVVALLLAGVVYAGVAAGKRPTKFEFRHLAAKLGGSGASRSRRDDESIQWRVSSRRSNAEIGVPVAPPEGPGAFLVNPLRWQGLRKSSLISHSVALPRKAPGQPGEKWQNSNLNITVEEYQDLGESAFRLILGEQERGETQ